MAIKEEEQQQQKKKSSAEYCKRLNQSPPRKPTHFASTAWK